MSKMSFATMAANNKNSTTSWSRKPQKKKSNWTNYDGSEDYEYLYHDDEYQGWTLDFEEAVLLTSNDGPSFNGNGSNNNVNSGKKKGSRGKKLLVSNGGHRYR